MSARSDPEVEAAATLAAAALSGLSGRDRRRFWAALRAAVAAVRGPEWEPSGAYAAKLAELAAELPPRRTTLLGVQPGGVVNRERGGTRTQGPPWASPSRGAPSAPSRSSASPAVPSNYPDTNKLFGH